MRNDPLVQYVCMDMNGNCTTNTHIVTVTVTAASLVTSFAYVTQGKTC
jgi:hypothetical protein